jgi:hypothetical protein
MSGSPSREESIDRFLQASEEMMKIGLSFSGNIEVAIGEFKQKLATILRTHFVEKGVAELLAQSFANFEKEVSTNLRGVNDIYTEGGRWYAFCVEAALGRPVTPPSPKVEAEAAPKVRVQGA